MAPSSIANAFPSWFLPLWRRIVCATLILPLIPELASGADVTVRDAAGLKAAIAKATPGTRILIEPGSYTGGFHFTQLRGEADRPIVLAAAQPEQPPIFEGKGMQFSAPAYVELRDLVFRRIQGNGLNIDDGGVGGSAKAHHVKLSGLRLADVGPEGNLDGIKLSGLEDFEIRDCLIERWGTGGSGIDMVGCHRGLIEGTTLRQVPGEQSSGIQCKGGTSEITIRRNRFENAGARAVNLGGSTGLEFFRPPLTQSGEHTEARDLRVEGNEFIGSASPIAFVGVDGAVVRFNTIYRPGRWAIRILQETKAPGFVPSRNGEFSDNLVVFHSDDWAAGGVNIGEGTSPETFRFARNWWYCLDHSSQSKPHLPTEEAGGVYGVDPLLRDPEKGELRPRSGSPAEKVGAHALPR